MENRKKLPIGIEFFEEIITEGFYYVDKTGLIKELLDNWSKVNLITRPRRFGKSLNMSMLRNFFEIGTNSQLFGGLAISKETALCDKYLGKFPVISISLKGVVGADFAKARAMMAGVICMEARRHSYLMNSDKLDQYDKNLLESLLLKEVSEDEMEHSLKTLSDLLYKHYGQKVIILIDEYDVPLAKAYEYGYYNEMVILIRSMFEQALKTNESLYLAVLTGCLRVSKESIFTGLNNPRILSITDVKLDEYFGFTDEEVRELLEYYGQSKRYKVVKEWYDGYKFGNVDVYCPWDVINYCDDLRYEPKTRPKNYWINTSGNDIIHKFLEKADDTTKWEIEQLIAGNTIEKDIHQELTYAELETSIDNLWSFLFTTGYLTYRKEEFSSDIEQDDMGEDEFEDGSDSNCARLTLAIPNREIRSIFKNQIYTWFGNHVRKDTSRLDTFCDALINGEAKKVEQLFNQYLSETISIRDTSIQKEMKENFYHGMLLGLLQYREDWLIRSNREAGIGYNDISVIYNAEKIGVVIEVKYAENDTLDVECAKALRQIDDKGYTSELKQFGMEKILKYGIACYRKKCKVVLTEE